MNNGSGYDLIIFTARQEEQYFLKTFFAPTEDTHYPEIQEVKPSADWDNLRIGLVNLGEMGNVASAIKAFEVLERVLPRCVVMVGLAGGYNPAEGSPKLRTGDVGLGRQIFYHSYGKETHKRREMRDKLDVPPPAGLQWVESQVADASFLKDVRALVRKWWDERGIFGEEKWLEQITNDKDRKKYENQEPPTDDIRAHTVNVSSGEEVIAHAERIKEIRAAHSVKEIILFEMESYGLGRVCHEFHIPFYLVKGISDYADAPSPWYGLGRLFSKRSQGKNDKNRWRAIAAASAVVLNLVKSGFRSHAVDPSEPKRPGAKHLVGCLHPDGRVLCRYQDADNHKADLRKCIHPGLMLKDATAAWLCRTFEDMGATSFSNKLEKSVKSLVENENACITTFFPYSARDLMLLFRRLSRNAQQTLLTTIEDGRIPIGERVKAMEQLITEIRPWLAHFLAFDAVCKEKGIKPHESARKQPQIARIIILDGSGPRDRGGLIDDPLSAAFPLLLGKHVPTYFVLAERLIKEKACTPDVTFIDHRLSRNKDGTTTANSQPEKKYGDLVALRFFEESNTLIVSGLLPCELVSNPDGIHPPEALHNLYGAWQTWCAGSTTYQGFFTEFPMAEIIAKHSLTVPDHSTQKPTATTT